jgi:hypothetical protein
MSKIRVCPKRRLEATIKAIEQLRKAMSLLRCCYQPKDYIEMQRDYKLSDYTPKYPLEGSKDWSKK